MTTNKPVKSNSKKEKYPRLFCYGMLRNDTLRIQISDLFLDQALMQIVSQKQVTISYRERYKHDYILKEKASDTLTNTLIIPVKISRFVLSEPDYKTGDIIYGSGEIMTNSYYKIRWRLKYYFKCRIAKEDKWQ